MKKSISVIAAIVMLTLIMTNMFVLADEVTSETVGQGEILVLINGEKVAFDQAPIIEEGLVLVPLRVVFEALDASVVWEGTTRTIFIGKGDMKILLQIDNEKMFKDNDIIGLDIPVKLINDRTFISLKTVEKALDVSVDWDAEASKVIIASGL